MQRLNRLEFHQAVTLINDEGDFPCLKSAADWLVEVERLAMALHALYERACNEPMSDTDLRAVTGHETRLRTLFAEHGLRLYLQSDPRGNPVGIHTPKTGRYNTLGGATDGWRL